MAQRRREFYEAQGVRISILATAPSRYAVYVDADQKSHQEKISCRPGGPYVFEAGDVLAKRFGLVTDNVILVLGDRKLREIFFTWNAIGVLNDVIEQAARESGFAIVHIL